MNASAHASAGTQLTLTVVMIVRNEAHRVARSLEAARRLTDDIVVLDGGSTDGTEAICRCHTPAVFVHPFDNYADQKNRAVAHARGEWILSLDADEEVTPELAAEIRSTLAESQASPTGPRAVAAYRIRRRSWIFGRLFRFTGTQDDKPVRLFRKGAAVFKNPVHEILEVSGETSELRTSLLHHTYANVKDYWQRLNRYTSMEADFFAEAKRPVARGGVCWLPAAMFARLYFWKQGFRDGFEGFVFSVLSAYYVFLKHAKHRERLAGAGTKTETAHGA